jgi:hypothetical protein
VWGAEPGFFYKTFGKSAAPTPPQHMQKKRSYNNNKNNNNYYYYILNNNYMYLWFLTHKVSKLFSYSASFFVVECDEFHSQGSSK